MCWCGKLMLASPIELIKSGSLFMRPQATALMVSLAATRPLT